MNQLLLLLPLCSTSIAQTQSPQPPEKVLMASLEAMRVNDLHGYLRLTLTDAQLAELRKSWNEYCQTKPSEDFRGKFSDVIAMLTSSTAEDDIMALLEPKLEEVRPQMAMVTGMVAAMGQMALQQNQQLTAAEREQGLKVLEGVANWLQHNDLTDIARARRAVHVLCDMLRSIGIETLDEVYAMSFEDVMTKGGKLLAAVKGVLQVYGVSTDDLLDSVQIRPVSVEGDVATLRVSFEFLGIESTSDTRMVRIGGRWVPEAVVAGMPAELAGLSSEG